MRNTSLTALAVLLLAVELSAAAVANDHPPLAEAPFNAEQAKEFQQRWAKRVGKEVIYTNSIGMKLILIPPGDFMMGLTEEQMDEMISFMKSRKELRDHAGGKIVWSMLMMPSHPVRITKPYYLGATEVTVAQFRKFVEASGYETEQERRIEGVEGLPEWQAFTWRKPLRMFDPPHEEKPVVELSWNDCMAFCEWLSKEEGKEYCLPTEAEWEYACRAGTTTTWHMGDIHEYYRVGHEYAHDFILRYPSMKEVKEQKGPRIVGLRKPNAFGLYDMHGNVWEYVADWWHHMYYHESPINDPTGPAVQSEKGDGRRIIRGGSFDFGSVNTQSAYRMRITQNSTGHHHSGFRIAMRIKGGQGVPQAVDPDDQRRRRKRDPGADSAEVLAALKAGATEAEHPKELTIDLGSDIKKEFALIPAGTFLMGSDKGPKDELPIHQVVISKPFYMAKYEVTQGQWEAIMGKHDRIAQMSNPKNEMTGPNKAMYWLNWNDCQDFIKRLKGKATGYAFALPTEAQWEYACRARSTSEYCFGDDESLLGQYAWCEMNMEWPKKIGNRQVLWYYDVGTKEPNRWGLCDMHGGMWEWCADRYDRDYYFDSPLVDPRGPDSGRLRVLRGGSWFRYGKYARSAYRRFFHPEGNTDWVTGGIMDFGCRVVINIE